MKHLPINKTIQLVAATFVVVSALTACQDNLDLVSLSQAGQEQKIAKDLHGQGSSDKVLSATLANDTESWRNETWRKKFEQAYVTISQNYFAKSSKKEIDEVNHQAFTDYLNSQLKAQNLLRKDKRGNDIKVNVLIPKPDWLKKIPEGNALQSRRRNGLIPDATINLFYKNYDGYPLYGPIEIAWIPNTSSYTQIYYEYAECAITLSPYIIHYKFDETNVITFSQTQGPSSWAYTANLLVGELLTGGASGSTCGEAPFSVSMSTSITSR